MDIAIGINKTTFIPKNIYEYFERNKDDCCEEIVRCAIVKYTKDHQHKPFTFTTNKGNLYYTYPISEESIELEHIKSEEFFISVTHDQITYSMAVTDQGDLYYIEHDIWTTDLYELTLQLVSVPGSFSLYVQSYRNLYLLGDTGIYELSLNSDLKISKPIGDHRNIVASCLFRGMLICCDDQNKIFYYYNYRGVPIHITDQKTIYDCYDAIKFDHKINGNISKISSNLDYVIFSTDKNQIIVAMVDECGPLSYDFEWGAIYNCMSFCSFYDIYIDDSVLDISMRKKFLYVTCSSGIIYEIKIAEQGYNLDVKSITIFQTLKIIRKSKKSARV